MTHFPDTTKMVPAMEPGYEIATEWREGLRYTNLSIPDHGWHDANEKQVIPQPGILFAAPIRLRLGENYRCKNGEETGCMINNGGRDHKTHPFYSHRLMNGFKPNGKFRGDDLPCAYDIVSHIPKKEEKKLIGDDGKPLSHWLKSAISAHKETTEKEEKKMEQTVQFKAPENFNICLGSGIITLPISTIADLAQLPKVQAEVKRIQEEREIGVGDWFWETESVYKAQNIGDDVIYASNGCHYEKAYCTKITDPAFIALLEAGIKGEVKP